jgi:hypothetical protein
MHTAEYRYLPHLPCLCFTKSFRGVTSSYIQDGNGRDGASGGEGDKAVVKLVTPGRLDALIFVSRECLTG